MRPNLKLFYEEMNVTAVKHKLTMSNFAVAHGLHHKENYSSAYDIAKLSKVALD